jgi:hypothetical protein
VRVRNVTGVAFDGAVVPVTIPAIDAAEGALALAAPVLSADATLGAGSAAAAAVPSPSPAAAGAAGAAGGSDDASSAALRANVTALSYVLETDCGAAWGNRTFLCGPGYEGREIAFACPGLTPLAACLAWDEAARSWSTEACAVRNVTATAVVCACTRFAPA